MHGDRPLTEPLAIPPTWLGAASREPYSLRENAATRRHRRSQNACSTDERLRQEVFEVDYPISCRGDCTRAHTQESLSTRRVIEDVLLVSAPSQFRPHAAFNMRTWSPPLTGPQRDSLLCRAG